MKSNATWVVLQARPAKAAPEWWPKKDGEAAWATCFPDGCGYSMIFDPTCVLQSSGIEELKEEWYADHDDRDWEFRTIEGAAPAPKRKKKRAAR